MAWLSTLGMDSDEYEFSFSFYFYIISIVSLCRTDSSGKDELMEFNEGDEPWHEEWPEIIALRSAYLGAFRF